MCHPQPVDFSESVPDRVSVADSECDFYVEPNRDSFALLLADRIDNAQPDRYSIGDVDAVADGEP